MDRRLKSANTIDRLITEARTQFAQKGYAAASTETIIADAGVKRGALYHHFEDKAALFEAVCKRIMDEAADAVRSATAFKANGRDALVAGSIAWLKFVTRADVRRILLIDGLSVLGVEGWQSLDESTGYMELISGLQAAQSSGDLRFEGHLQSLAVMLNGALNGLAMKLSANDISEAVALSTVEELFKVLCRH